MNDKIDFENLEKIVKLDVCKGDICAVKNIKVLDCDNFLLDKRSLINDYRKTTKDYKTGLLKSFFTGKLKLNGRQIENYQHEYSMKLDKDKISFDKIYSDVD
jgi:hypothetical protein